jgi:hypothetical protein
MSTKFNRLRIATDEVAAKKYNSDLRLKKRYINELHKYCSKYVTISDKSLLQSNFYDTFIQLFLDKYENEFPPISVSKMLEAMEIDTKYINKVSVDIEAIKIDLDSELEPTQKVDFSIYTENENQNKLLRTAQRLCKELNSLKADHNIRMIPQGIVQGTSQLLVYNWAEQCLSVNTRAVLGKNLMR